MHGDKLKVSFNVNKLSLYAIQMDQIPMRQNFENLYCEVWLQNVENIVL